MDLYFDRYRQIHHIEKETNQMVEISREELFAGSGIYCVTIETVKYRIVTNGLCGMTFGPFSSKEEAQQYIQEFPVGLADCLVGSFKHRRSFYERGGKEVK